MSREPLTRTPLSDERSLSPAPRRTGEARPRGDGGEGAELRGLGGQRAAAEDRPGSVGREQGAAEIPRESRLGKGSRKASTGTAQRGGALSLKSVSEDKTRPV